VICTVSLDAKEEQRDRIWRIRRGGLLDYDGCAMLKQDGHQLEPLDRQTIAAGVTDRLRRAILDGAYPPGQQLVERHLGAQLGVSTIAIREAFARLVEEGLIVRRPHRGAFVAQFDLATLLDVSRVRIPIEVLAVELAVESWTPDAERSARALVAEMVVQARAGNADGLVALDAAFHEHFWRIAASEALLEVAIRLRSRVVRMVREAMLLMDPSELSEIAQIHEDWVDAVASGDVARAQLEVGEHIRRSTTALAAHLARREQPDLAPK